MKNRKKKKGYTRKPVHLVIPDGLRSQLTNFLREKSADGREAYASLLCGKHDRPRLLRLLTRHIILPEDDCFKSRTAGGIEMNREIDHHILKMAEDESLTVVQVHTHLHKGRPVFSGIDDHSERKRAEALGRHLNLTLASCVFDKDARHGNARLWRKGGHGTYKPASVRLVSSVSDSLGKLNTRCDPRFDRQVLAFGAGLQARMDKVKIGVVGLGGLGAVIVEGLSRLGVRNFVLADSDRAEVSNLNRLTGATHRDAEQGTPKVDVARRNINQMHGRKARVRCFHKDIPDPDVARALADCHIIVAATDTHSSRQSVMELGAAFLRPVVNAGVGFVADNGRISRIEARVSSPPVGGPWCLSCGGHIDAFEAVREMSDPESMLMLRERGYIKDTPAPAVYWVNMRTAAEALGVIHALIMPYREKETPEPSDILIDLLNPETLPISHSSEENDCVVCGAGGLRGIGDAFFNSGRLSMAELNLKEMFN